MTDINHVIIIGNLTRDMETKYTQGGMCIGSMSIASNRSRKIDGEYKDEVSFFNVKLFGRTAENLKQYLIKGQKVAIDGFLKQDRWEKDGQAQSMVYIVAENIQLIGGRKEGNAPKTESRSYPSGDGFQEDIPF